MPGFFLSFLYITKLMTFENIHHLTNIALYLYFGWGLYFYVYLIWLNWGQKEDPFCAHMWEKCQEQSDILLAQYLQYFTVHLVAPVFIGLTWPRYALREIQRLKNDTAPLWAPLYIRWQLRRQGIQGKIEVYVK